MSRHTKKLKYIRLKNSWRVRGVDVSKPFTLTTCIPVEFLPRPPKSTETQLWVDFRDRDAIVKYGVRCIGGFCG